MKEAEMSFSNYGEKNGFVVKARSRKEARQRALIKVKDLNETQKRWGLTYRYTIDNIKRPFRTPPESSSNNKFYTITLKLG